MKNPLAAAAILALADDGARRDAIERAIRHYDYSKLHMSEFFFAECAYYALPAKECLAPVGSFSENRTERYQG